MAKRRIAASVALMAAMGLVYLCTMQPPEAMPAAAERLTQTVELQALSGTALQMDTCETAQQARVSAARLTGRGSAGYVHQDGGYRVLGIMTETREEAEQMQKRLSDSGILVELMDCSGQSLTLKVTAEARHIESLTAAIHAVDMAALQPGRIAQQLDAGEIDGDRARGLVAMLVRDAETAQADFRDAGAQGALSEGLDALLERAIDALTPLTEDAAADDVRLAGEVRCAGMAVWFAREALIAQLSQ